MKLANSSNDLRRTASAAAIALCIVILLIQLILIGSIGLSIGVD